MAPGRRRLTATEVEAAGPGWLWDAEVPGLGVRVLASGVRSYVYRYGSGRRGAGRRVTLGQHGELTLDQARRLARRLVGRLESRCPDRRTASAWLMPARRRAAASRCADASPQRSPGPSSSSLSTVATFAQS